MKIYCVDCKFYRKVWRNNWCAALVEWKENYEKVHKDWTIEPSTQNKNNDCAYYVKKSIFGRITDFMLPSDRCPY